KRFAPYPAVSNVTGQPSVSLPLHWTDGGLPVGVMLSGRMGGEATLISLSAQLEAARPWHDRHPPLWEARPDEAGRDPSLPSVPTSCEPEVGQMMPEPRGGALVGRGVNVLAALCVSAAVLALFAVGYGPLPALGRALDPGHGAWASAAGGQPVHSQTLSLPGLA